MPRDSTVTNRLVSPSVPALRTAQFEDDGSQFDDDIFGPKVTSLPPLLPADEGDVDEADIDDFLFSDSDKSKNNIPALPDPVPAGQDPRAYFEANYEALGADPMAYGWYQGAFMRAAWADHGSAGFCDLVKPAGA